MVFLASLRRRVDRWLFRLRPDEPAPVVLVQRRIFVLPTPAGLAYGVTLVTLLVASINYTLSLGYAFTFLLAGAAVSSIVHAFRNLLGLRIQPTGAEAVFAGDMARFALTIANPSRRPRPALAARIPRGPWAPFAAPAEAATVVDLRCPAPRRGRLPLGRVTLETVFPLGLIRAWSVVSPHQEALVYPAPEADPPPLPLAPAVTAGDLHGRYGQDDFDGLRAHVPTDSPRHIAWKVYAREGPLVVKEFAGGDDGEIALEWAALPASLDTEARLSRLAAWVCEARRRGCSFRLSLPGQVIPAGAGEAHARRCLEALALYGESPGHGSD